MIAYDVENEGIVNAKEGKIELIRSDHHLIINSEGEPSGTHLPTWSELQGSLQTPPENVYSLALHHTNTPDALEITKSNERFLLQIAEE